jgi:hypothetical protein
VLLGPGSADVVDDVLPPATEYLPPGRLYWYRFCAHDDAAGSTCRNVSVAVVPGTEAMPVARCGPSQWLLAPQSSARVEGVLRCPASQPVGCTLRYAWSTQNASATLDRTNGTVVLAANASEAAVSATVRNLAGTGAYVVELRSWSTECGQQVRSTLSTMRVSVAPRPSLTLRDVSAGYPSQSTVLSARVTWRPVAGIENGTTINVSWFPADDPSCPRLSFTPQQSQRLWNVATPGGGADEMAFNASTSKLARGSFCAAKASAVLYSPSWSIAIEATAGIRIGGLFLCPIGGSSGSSGAGGGGGNAGARCLPSFLSRPQQQTSVRAQAIFVGFSAGAFNAGARASFAATIAAQLNISSSSVSIVGVADTAFHRRRLAAQVAVDFRVASAAPDSMKAALNALGSGAAAQQVLATMKTELVSRNVSFPVGLRMEFPTPASIDLTTQVNVVGTTYDSRATQCFERFQLAVERTAAQPAAENIYDGGAVQLDRSLLEFRIANNSQSPVPHNAKFRCQMLISSAVDARTGAVVFALLSGSTHTEREGIGTVAFGAQRPVFVHAMSGTVLTLTTRCTLHGDPVPDHVSKPIMVQPLLNLSLQTGSWPNKPVAPWRGLPSLTAMLTSTASVPDEFTNSTVCSLRLGGDDRTSDVRLGGQTMARAMNNTLRFDGVSVQAIGDVPLFGRRLELELECKYGNMAGRQSSVTARRSIEVANLTVRVMDSSSRSINTSGAVAAQPIKAIVLEVLGDGGTPVIRRTDDQYTVCVVTCTRGCIGTLARTASSGLVTFDDLGFKTAKLDVNDDRTLEIRCSSFGSQLQVQRVHVTVVRCPEGKRPNTARTACQRTCECDRTQYQPTSETAVVECKRCPTHAKTIHDSVCDSRCVCAAGYFDTTDGVGPEPVCTECSHAALAANSDCLRDGLTFSSLSSDRGYWQDKTFFETKGKGLRFQDLAFEKCQEPQECRDLKNPKGAELCRCRASSNHSLVSGTGCRTGHNGPLCMTCLEGYQMAKDRYCINCVDNGDVTKMVGSLVALLIALVLLFWVVLKFKKRYEEMRKELRQALLWLDRHHGA